MLRFVHIADVHLDSPFRSRDPELRRRLADAGREAFNRALALTIESQSHALVIAGDLFDDDRRKLRTELFLSESFQRLREEKIAVVIAAGNHDPGSPELAAYRAADDWPENVLLARGRDPVSIVATDRKGRARGRFVAVGHAGPCEEENLSRRFPRADASSPSVAVLHTQIQSAEGAPAHRKYAPCSPGDLAMHAYDYWALGHVHNRQQVSAQPAAYYPGNLQGRHFGECGAKGALLVEIPRAGAEPKVRFEELAPLRWDRLIVRNLAKVRDPQQLVETLGRAYEQFSKEEASAARRLLRLRIEGPCGLNARLRENDEAEDLAEVLRTEFDLVHFEWDFEAMRSPVDLEDLRLRSQLVERTLSRLEELRRDPSRVEELLGGPMASGIGRKESRRQQLRSELLDDLEGLIVDTLIDDSTGRRP